MGLRDVLDNRKAESSAAQLSAACLVYPVEPFKEPGQVFFFNAAALVSNIYLDFFGRLTSLHPDGASHSTVLDSIVKEVHDGLLKKWCIDL